MFNELISIAQNLWAGFFPMKKGGVVPPHLQPPMHYNCRCFAEPIFDEEMVLVMKDGRSFPIPPTFESRKQMFDEACHDDYIPSPLVYSADLIFTDQERIELAKFIDKIYEKKACVVCFNQECTCRHQ